MIERIVAENENYYQHYSFNSIKSEYKLECSCVKYLKKKKKDRNEIYKIKIMIIKFPK